MATSMVSVPKNTWTLISAVSVSFQVPEQSSVLAVEAATPPTTTAIRKKIQPGKIYSFQKLDGNLYAYSRGADIEIAIDPVV